MRTRLVHWAEFESRAGKRSSRVRVRMMYGVDVYVNGSWHHAHRNGDPLLFDREDDAQAERKELRKLRADECKGIA